MVDVSSRGTVEVHFHENNTIRFAEDTIDLGQVQSVVEMLEMLRHKKEMLRKQGMSILLTLRLTGEGVLSEVASDNAVRASWIEESQAEETGKHGVYIIGIECDTFSSGTQGVAPGMVSDYVKALDAMDVGVDSLLNIVKERPEWKRLGMYGQLVTDDMVQSAYEKARLEGIRLLQGNEYED